MFKELFDEADLNKDGKLDKQEMEKNLEEREEWIKGEAAQETMQVADDNKDGKVSLNEVIKNAGQYGAKTEDFFEDSELLHVGDDNAAESAMVKESEDGHKIKYHYTKYARPDLGPNGYHVRVASADADNEAPTGAASNEAQGEWDGTMAGAKNLRGGN